MNNSRGSKVFEGVLFCLIFVLAMSTNYYGFYLHEYLGLEVSISDQFVEQANQCKMQDEAIERINIWRNSFLFAFLALAIQFFLLLNFSNEIEIRMSNIERDAFSQQRVTAYQQKLAVLSVVCFLLVKNLIDKFDVEHICGEHYSIILDILSITATTFLVGVLLRLLSVWAIAMYLTNCKN